MIGVCGGRETVAQLVGYQAQPPQNAIASRWLWKGDRGAVVGPGPDDLAKRGNAQGTNLRQGLVWFGSTTRSEPRVRQNARHSFPERGG